MQPYSAGATCVKCHHILLIRCTECVSALLSGNLVPINIAITGAKVLCYLEIQANDSCSSVVRTATGSYEHI